MVFHLVRSLPAVVTLAATITTLSLGNREEAVSSCAEDSSLSLLQRQSIRLGNVKSSNLANAAPAPKVSATQVVDGVHRAAKHELLRGAELKDVPPFYMYDDPVFTVIDDLHNCYESIDKEWPSYVDISQPFHSQLERHPRRVTEGSAAEWFIVPFDFDLNAMLGDCNGTTAKERVDAAMDALAASPFFKKSQGKDHVIVAMLFGIYSGVNKEYMPPKHRALLHNMVIAHYMDQHLHMNDQVYGWKPILHPGRLISKVDWRCTWVLPVQSAEGLWKEDESFEEWNKRPNTIFFRGHGTMCLDHGAEELRQSAHLLEGIVPNIIVNNSHADSFDQYMQEITSSKFCLVMRCDDPQTSRMVDALAAGCIPVIISDAFNLMVKPFAPQINYDAFTVSIDESIWMENTIAAARFAYNWSPQQMRRLHASLQAARSQLLWNHPESQVASVALRELSESCRAE